MAIPLSKLRIWLFNWSSFMSESRSIDVLYPEHYPDLAPKHSLFVAWEQQ